MRTNYYTDWREQDALARLTEQAWQERRLERIAEDRRLERERRMKTKWVVNIIMIVTMCLASFAAGLVAGVL